jgi:hypothetical protein
MWGYVSPYSSLTGKTIESKTTRSLLKEIQRLVFLHDVVYLKESTALGELQAWMRQTPLHILRPILP